MTSHLGRIVSIGKYSFNQRRHTTILDVALSSTVAVDEIQSFLQLQGQTDHPSGHKGNDLESAGLSHEHRQTDTLTVWNL